MPEDNPIPQFDSAPRMSLKRIEAVVNAASGSVGPDAKAQLEKIVADAGLQVHAVSPPPQEIGDAIRAAVAARPDLLIVLAGDGTAALAAELCGMEGPLVAPLPGGTMNMLPHALYGHRAWPEALSATLAEGQPRTISCGEAAGRPFYVAAILGAPALWGEAREALRKGRFRLALLKARRAFLRAFSGSLHFSLQGKPGRKTEALTLMCPLVSTVLDRDDRLEAAALDPHGAGEAFRLGVRTLVGGWRDDPSVTTEVCTEAKAWARGRIPAVIDGEPHRLDSPVSIRFIAQGFRAFAPPPGAEEAKASAKEGERTGAEAAQDAAAAQVAKPL